MSATPKRKFHIFDLPTEVRWGIWERVVRHGQVNHFIDILRRAPNDMKAIDWKGRPRKRPVGRGPLFPPALLATCKPIYDDMKDPRFIKGLKEDMFSLPYRDDFLYVLERAPARNLQMVRSMWAKLQDVDTERGMWLNLENQDLGKLSALSNLRLLSLEVDMLRWIPGLLPLHAERADYWLDTEVEVRDIRYRTLVIRLATELPSFFYGLKLMLEDHSIDLYYNKKPYGDPGHIHFGDVLIKLSCQLDKWSAWQKLDVEESHEAYDEPHEQIDENGEPVKFRLTGDARCLWRTIE